MPITALLFNNSIIIIALDIVCSSDHVPKYGKMDNVFISTFTTLIFYLAFLVVSRRSMRGVQHNVIQFVSDLWQVGGFLQIHPHIKMTATI